MDNPLDLAKVVQDVSLEAIPDDTKLSRLANLCRHQLDLENDIEGIETALEKRKEDLRQVSEIDIPSLMDEIGISEFKLSNGIIVRVAPFFTGDTKNPESVKWLEENGHGDIIKGSLVVHYPKGYDQVELMKIVGVADALKLPVDNREEVHHSTLRSWIKDMVKSGTQFPKELFNVYVGRRAKLSLK